MSSAFWMALSAAPFQRLSPLTQRARPFWKAVSTRIRPTPHLTLRLKSSGVGYCRLRGVVDKLGAGKRGDGVPGLLDADRALEFGVDRAEWARTTGTRTQVAETADPGAP